MATVDTHRVWQKLCRLYACCLTCIDSSRVGLTIRANSPVRSASATTNAVPAGPPSSSDSDAAVVSPASSSASSLNPAAAAEPVAPLLLLPAVLSFRALLRRGAFALGCFLTPSFSERVVLRSLPRRCSCFSEYRLSNAWTMGMANARVLPDPVCAAPTTSRRWLIAAGMHLPAQRSKQARSKDQGQVKA